MRDLYSYIRSLRQKLLQKNARSFAPRPMMINIRVHVYRDCHPMLIRTSEHPAQLSELFRTVDIDIRVAKVQLELSPVRRFGSCAQRAISSTAWDLSGLTLQNSSNRSGYCATCALVQSFSLRFLINSRGLRRPNRKNGSRRQNF
jgi:hypothetical protein